jgi:hypothetical protein
MKVNREIPKSAIEENHEGGNPKEIADKDGKEAAAIN